MSTWYLDLCCENNSPNFVKLLNYETFSDKKSILRDYTLSTYHGLNCFYIICVVSVVDPTINFEEGLTYNET